MMDAFVQQKLVEWDLVQLLESFERNEIDEITFHNLTEGDIKELIPILGQRKKFLIKYDTYVKLEQESKSTTTITSEDEEVLTSIPRENVSTSFLGLDDISRSLGHNFPDFNLQTLLESSANGKKIIKYYKENNILNDSSRTILIDIIVKSIYTYISQHRLKQDQYQLITDKVIRLFPRESEATYYCPYVPKKESGKCTLAKGRLVDKVRNVLYRSGDTIRCRKRPLDPTDVERTTISDEVDSEVQSSLTFLKYLDHPWEEVIHHWRKTVSSRRNCKFRTVSEFLAEWPILRNNNSSSLINLDFDHLYADRSLELFNNWTKFWETIVTVKGKHNIKDASVIDFMNIIECETTNKDIKHLYQLKALCYIVPPKGRLRGKTENWKFSIQECLESILLIAPTPGDVDKLINDQKEKARLRKYPLQPFICVIGNLEESISSIFVVIDKIQYQCDTVLNSIDLLFKIFHVFNADYPPASEHIWFLIQRGIYKIKTNYDKNFPYVMHFVKSLEENI